MMLRILIVLVLLAGLPIMGDAQHARDLDELIDRARGAGADAALMIEIRSRGQSAGLSHGQIFSMIEPGAALAEQDLPSRTVLQKVLEGLAKNVPVDRIAAVVQNQMTLTLQASETADPWLSRGDVAQITRGSSGRGGRNELIESTAHALGQGVPLEVIERVLDRIPTETGRAHIALTEVAMVMRVLPDIPMAKTQPSATADLLVQALRAEFSPNDLRQLPAALATAQHHSRLPAEAIARGATDQIHSGLPAATVLHNLFQGNFPGVGQGSIPPGLNRVPQAQGTPGRGQN